MVLCCRLGARIHSGAVSVVADSGGVFLAKNGFLTTALWAREVFRDVECTSDPTYYLTDSSDPKVPLSKPQDDNSNQLPFRV